MTESLTQKLFAALNKNRSVNLNDYEVSRISGLSAEELEQAKGDLEEILKGSDTTLAVDKKGVKDRSWKMVTKRPKPKKEEKEEGGLF